MLLLQPSDVKGLISIQEAVEGMEQGLLEWGNNRWRGELRQRVHAGSGVRLTVHIGAPDTAGVMGVLLHTEKIVIHDDDIQTLGARGARVRVVYDSKTCELLSIQIGELEVKELPGVNQVVVIPTSCATAVGTKWLAKPGSRKIGILGSRGQAKGQLAATKAAIPTLEKAKVFSPSPENREAFAREMIEVCGIDVEPVASTEEAMQDVDILLTATNSNVPTFPGELLTPGMHVSAVVSSNKGLHEGGFIPRARREVDDETLRRADVIVCNNTGQEKLDRTAVVWQTCEDGVIGWDKVWDLGQVMSDEVPGRSSDDEITFFKQNAFWGVGDQVIGRLLLDRAREQDLGIEIDVPGWESQTDSGLEGMPAVSA